MNRTMLALTLFLAGTAFGADGFFENAKGGSSAILSKEIGKDRVAELVPVSVEARQFLLSSGKFASINKVVFVSPKTETQRKPSENTPLNIEARMADIEARSHEGASPTIFQYKAYVVTSGDREKISEENL